LATPRRDAALKSLADDPAIKAMSKKGERWDAALKAAHAAAAPYREALASMNGRDLTPTESVRFQALTDEANLAFRKTLEEHGFSEGTASREPEPLDEIEVAILRELANKLTPPRQADIAKVLRRDEKTIRRCLYRLRDRKLTRKVGKGRSGETLTTKGRGLLANLSG